MPFSVLKPPLVLSEDDKNALARSTNQELSAKFQRDLSIDRQINVILRKLVDKVEAKVLERQRDKEKSPETPKAP